MPGDGVLAEVGRRPALVLLPEVGEPQDGPQAASLMAPTCGGSRAGCFASGQCACLHSSHVLGSLRSHTPYLGSRGGGGEGMEFHTAIISSLSLSTSVPLLPKTSVPFDHLGK